MHIPPFIKSVDEDDTIFSIPRYLRTKLLERLVEANVSTIFSGHYHRNAGGFWSHTNPDGSTSKVRLSFEPLVRIPAVDTQENIFFLNL